MITGSGTYSETLYAPFTWEEVLAACGTENPRKIWDPGPQQVDLGGGNIATFDLYLAVEAYPRLELGFAVTAGQNDTHFSFSTEVLTFAEPLTNISAYAAVGAHPSFTSGIVAGGFGGKAYRALYNGSQIYADLVDTPLYYPGSDPFTTQSISGQVSSMQAMWDFTVSANGSASGTSEYQITGDIIPEPATILLFGLGLTLLRKRK
ncbi:MAG: PEP-CTERM sorting domain-containing protein [Sedimentisphaerales bacterium]|nr:PEP-CTERM sorting domain-containing protein [Sedimentisphaerales bacterium]